MSDYKLIPITELLSDIIDNRGKSCPTQESGFPLIATNCIKHSSIYPTFENIRYVSEETRNNWFRAELKPNDILFVNKGTPGRVCLVPDPITFCAAQDMVGLRANPDKIYYKYLFALLRSTFIQQKIANFHVGIAIPHFKKSDMDKLLIPVPDMKLQIKIGDMYCQLSEKIETNNRINAELESMAKTIYDYWFTQFDFPNENGKPYKSSGGKMVWNEELKREIPEGWGILSLSNSSNIQYGMPLSTSLFGNNGKPVIRIRDIESNSISAYTSEEVSDEYLTKIGDLLIGMDGNFQMNYWSRDNDVVNQRIARIRKTKLPTMLIKFQIQPIISAKVHNVARSTVGHLSDKDIKGIFILTPKNTLNLDIFDEVLNKICKLREENQQLASLRDWLLPMLMNGQVGFES